jgi:hypothetical protein
MRLVARPVRPKRSPLLTMKLRNPKYATWSTWLEGSHYQALAIRTEASSFP